VTNCPRCQAHRETSSGPCPGCLLVDDAPLLVGRYRLDDEVGEGGMGVVFKAFDLKLQRVVAAKVAKGPLDEELKSRFLKEAQLLAALRHPSIVSALDVGEDEGELFIIMDFIHGVPLSRWSASSHAELEQMGRDLCDALDHAHNRGVIHRDIKPENILVDRDGRARLTDFGIARLVEDSHRLTKDGHVAGTPRYMAPEALRGETPTPGHDLYSLGLVFKELIERTSDPNAAPRVAAVVEAATSADVRQRFTSAKAMSTAFTHGPSRTTGEQSGERTGDLWSAALWLRPLAVLMAIATASVLWAFLLSVTPRVIARSEVGPLVMTQVQDLGNGMVVSTARFETGAWLMAFLILAISGAFLTVWLILPKRRPHQGPSESPSESRWLFGLGLVNVSLWALHVLVIGREGPGWLVRYMPIGGGLVEVALLVLLWTAVLECLLRHQNPLRNGWLWGGAVLMVLPPSIELLHYIETWRP
jgi:predicted Ser/Thr protein kinase